MATTTTNYGLTKPAYSDTADIAVLNTNTEKIDTALGGLNKSIAIVSKNNTHGAVTEGQYVYVYGHGSLAEGLYTAKSNIAANATLSTSNLSAAGGALNDINAKAVAVRDATNLGSFSTQAELETLLNTALDGMPSYSGMLCRVAASANFSWFTNTYIYYCMLYKAAVTGNYVHVMMHSNASAGVISGFKTTSGWTFERVTTFESTHAAFMKRSETAIPANSLLSNYNTPGVYYIQNATIAASISDCPFKQSGGRLEVMGQNSDSEYLRHMYYPSGITSIYLRIKTANGWAIWYKLSLETA